MTPVVTCHDIQGPPRVPGKFVVVFGMTMTAASFTLILLELLLGPAYVPPLAPKQILQQGHKRSPNFRCFSLGNCRPLISGSGFETVASFSNLALCPVLQRLRAVVRSMGTVCSHFLWARPY